MWDYVAGWESYVLHFIIIGTWFCVYIVFYFIPTQSANTLVCFGGPLENLPWVGQHWPKRFSCLHYIKIHLYSCLRCLASASLLLSQQRLLQLQSSSSFSGGYDAKQEMLGNDTHLQHQLYHFSSQFFAEGWASCRITPWDQLRNLVLSYRTTWEEGRRHVIYWRN